MSSLTFSNNLGTFANLAHNGVHNFFTFSNEKWGDMKRLAPMAVSNYQSIFNDHKVESVRLLAMGAEHNDNIRHITKENFEVYWTMNTEKDETPAMRLWCDAFITKEKIPMIVSPADCCVVALTGVDKLDGKRFLMLIHAGFTGAILDITTKTVNYAHALYEFDTTELTGVVFPYIHEKHFLKTLHDTRVQKTLQLPVWKDFLTPEGDLMSVAFGRKVERELTALGITFETADIDTFQANIEGKLMSESYLKSTGEDKTKRFGIGVCLK